MCQFVVARDLAAQGTDKCRWSRAPRFQVQLPLKYRCLDEENGNAGETRNISRSGLLFQAEDLLQRMLQLEITLVLPAEIAGLSPRR